MTLAEAIQHPSVVLRLLFEVTAGKRIQNWVATGGAYANTYQASISGVILECRFNLSTLLTSRASIALVDANAGSFYHDAAAGVLYVRPPGVETVFGENVVQPILSFFWATKQGTYNGRYYEARVKSAPVISMRIEEKFGAVSQVGGGTLTLNNGDKFFSQYTNLEWTAGRVVVKLGVDVPPDHVTAYADFQKVATWLVDDWTGTDETFSLKLREIKGRIAKKIPTEVFEKSAYPQLPNDSVGKPIPLAYGKCFSVAPVLIDAGLRKFKVAGHAIKSFDLVKIKTNDVWQTTAFATTDETLGEFTLGAQWNGSDSVCVDLTGKVDGAGVLIENPSDIAKDILATIGETDINTAAFALAKARLDVGATIDARAVIRKYSTFIDSETDALALIKEISSNCFTYLFSDSNGQYTFGVFEPSPSEGLPAFSDVDVLEFGGEETEARATNDGLISKVIANYQLRAEENNRQVTTAENTGNQYEHGNPGALIRTQDLSFWDLSDAIYWAQRTLVTDGRLHKRFRVQTYWRGMFTLPGDLIILEYARQGISGVFEVYDVKHDFLAGKVSLVIGNLRGFTDQPGFWVNDASTLPARFASLTGYGAGALDPWNPLWDPAIKAWARQNVGWWTDENGFVDPTDPDSFIASVWF